LDHLIPGREWVLFKILLNLFFVAPTKELISFFLPIAIKLLTALHVLRNVVLLHCFLDEILHVAVLATQLLHFLMYPIHVFVHLLSVR